MKLFGKGKTIQIGSLVLMAVILAAGGASAEIIKHFEFNSEGVLPSVDPQIAYLAPSGNVEQDIYSVSGGILTGYHVPGGGQPIKYLYPGEMNGTVPINGGISPTEPWMVEIRARVIWSEGSQYLGAFTLWNGNFLFRICFFENGVRVNRTAGTTQLDYPCDISQWHVLRMWGEGGSDFSASVDGVLFANHQLGINDANIINGFTLQLNPHGEGAHVEWDFVRFEAGENAIATEDRSFGAVKALFR